MAFSASAARATSSDAALARAIARYNELCADPSLGGPATIASFVDAMRTAGLVFGGSPQCRSLRPAFLTRERVAAAAAAVRTLWTAFAAIERHALADPAVALELGLSADELALAAIDPGYDGTTAVARLDAFFDQRLEVVEYNADSPAGMSYEAGQAALLRDLPVMQRFAAEFAVEHLAADQSLRRSLLSVWAEFRSRRLPAARATPTVAIVDLAGAPTTAEFHIVAHDLRANGVSAFVCSPDDLAYDGVELRAGDRRIDLVYRRLLVSDFLARYDLRHPLAAAYRDGAVCVASSFRCKIAHKKMALAMMRDPSKASWFDAAQHDAIGRLVPPIAPLTAATLSAALRERQSLVLKPNDSHGGRGVTIGWEIDDAGWHATLNAALCAGRFVLQRRAAARYETFPIFDPDAPELGLHMQRLLVDCNPFVFRDGEVGGFLTRLSPTAVVNVARGGQAVPTFVLAE